MSLTNSVDQTGNLKVSSFQRLSFGLVLSFGIGAFGLIPTLIPTLAETKSPQSPQGEPVILRQRSPAGVMYRVDSDNSHQSYLFRLEALDRLGKKYEEIQEKPTHPHLYFSYELRRMNETQAQVVCLMAAQFDSNWVEIKVEPGKMEIGPDGKPIIGENGLAVVNSDGSNGMIRTGSDSTGTGTISSPITPTIIFAVQPDTDAVVISFKLKQSEAPIKLIMRLDDQRPTSGAMVID